MSITEKIKDVVLGPKKPVVIYKVEEGLEDIEIRYIAHIDIHGGPFSDFTRYDDIIGRKVSIKFRELETDQIHTLDCYVKKEKNFSPDYNNKGSPYICSRRDLITREELELLTKLVGEPLETRIKRQFKLNLSSSIHSYTPIGW